MNTEGLPKTRQEAKEKGFRYYFTGKPCRRGHLAVRVTSCHACTQCGTIKARDWRNNNRDRARQINRNWAKANPEKRRESKHLSYRRRPEISAKYAIKWRMVNQGRHAATLKEWRSKNRDKVSVLRRLRYSRAKGAGGEFTPKDIRGLLGAQEYVCLCGASLLERYTIDHILPVSRGGSSWPSNLQMLCKPCNNRKSTKTMEEWVFYYG